MYISRYTELRHAVYLTWFGGTVAGVLLGRYANIQVVIIVISALALLAAGTCIVLPQLRKVVVLSFAFTALGALLMYFTMAGISGGILPELAVDCPATTVKGRIVSNPVASGGETRFFVETYEVRSGDRMWESRERVQVTFGGDVSENTVYSGVMVSVSGRVKGGEGSRWLIDRGAATIIKCDDEGLEVTGRADAVSRMVKNTRGWLKRSYGRLYPKRVSGFIEGVTTGRKDDLDPGIASDLRSSGLSHIVAVSGLHVSAVVALLLSAGTALGAGKRTRLLAACVAIALLIGVAGFRPSAMRASLMAGLCFGGMLMGRKSDPISGLCLAGFILIFANTRILFDQGFILSFSATLGIVYAVRMVERQGALKMLLLVCAGAQTGVLPLIVARGEAVPVTAIAANVAVLPLVGPLLATSWCASILSEISLKAGKAVALIPRALTGYIISVSKFLSKVPGSGTGGLTSAVALVLYLAGLVWLILRIRERKSISRPLIAILCSVLVAAAPIFIAVTVPGQNRITVMDVGQGDAILIRDRYGSVVLVDGGPEERRVASRLRSWGVGKIDLMISSHPHADHVTGLAGVMEEFPVGLLLDSGVPAQTSTYRRLMETARDKNVPYLVAREGQVLRLSPLLSIEVTYGAELATDTENLNNCSVVVMVNLDGASVLLAADLEIEGQRVMMGFHPDLSCDVLKVPHQGAMDAALQEFIESTDPQLGVVSVGKDNSYGHPSKQHVEMLENRGIKVLRTDIMGDIEITVDRGRIGVATER